MALTGEQIRTGDAAEASQIVGMDRRNMVHLLGYAVDNQLWAHAGTLFSALREFWNRRGLTEDIGAWVDRIMPALIGPNDAPPPLGEDSGKLWQLLVDTRAEYLTRASQLDAAVNICTEALDLLAGRSLHTR